MTIELSPVSNIVAPVATLSLTVYCADVQIRQGEGNTVEVSAQTPTYWSVTEDGRITEVGGPVAEALKRPNSSSSFNNNFSFSSGYVNGVFQINGRAVIIPDPREQLVIYLPAGFAGDVEIEAEYFGVISVEAALRGKVKAKVSMKVALKMVDQKTVTGANIKASMGASVSAGAITARGGKVKLTADMSDSSVTTGNVWADAIDVKAGCGGQVSGKNLAARQTVEIKADMDGSRADFGDVWADTLALDADMSARIKLARADARTWDADADMSARITVLAGSGASGRCKGDMSGVVNLTGDFAALKRKRDMGGQVNVTAVKGDAGERFLSAAKRDFNRDLWHDTYACVIVMAMAASMAPAMLQGAAETLTDDATVGVICQAMGPTLRDAAVLESIDVCARALESAVGPVENLKDPQALGLGLQSPAVAEAFGKTFQQFVGTVFKTAETLAA